MTRVEELLVLRRRDPDVKQMVNIVVARSGMANVAVLELQAPEVFDDLYATCTGMVEDLGVAE